MLSESKLSNKKVYLTLDSTNRSSGNVSTPIFTLSETLPRVRSVTVDRAEIYYNWFYFNTGNNVLGSSINGSTITIAAGTYTPSTLSLTLQTAIRATGGGFSAATVTYSSLTYKYTISSGSVSTFTIASSGALAQILGFSSDKTLVTTATSDFAAYEQRIVLMADNRSFDVTQSAITATINIPAGSYSGSLLASHLQTQLNASFTNFTVTFNSYNSTLTFTHTTTDFTITYNAVAALLGFTSTASSSSFTLTSPQSINITGNTSVIIKSNALANNTLYPSIQGAQYANKIIEIPLAGAQNNVLFFETQKNNPVSFYFSRGISLSTIDLRLLDDNGKIVNFNVNGRWKLYITVDLF